MIINIAYPLNNTQKTYSYKEEKFWSKLYDRKLGEEVNGDQFGDGTEEFSGHIFKITGGSDNNGFAMKQGVVTKNKVKLLLSKESVGYFCRRKGVRKRKTVRGCIIGSKITSVNMILVEKGEGEIAGLTDIKNELRLGPKRANKIRKLFNLPKHSDNVGKENAPKVEVSNIDVMKAVVKRVTKEKNGVKFFKAPRITRLLTKERIRRKKVKRVKKINKVKENAERRQQYMKLLE